MDLQLQSLTETLEQADYRVRSGSHNSERVWPTGFDVLDANLSGGFRSGDLVLIGGPQGMGKTTWVLQVARNVARQGRPVLYFCYEHDQTTMLVRLVALEAGLIGGIDAPGINRVRSTFEAADGLGRSLSQRLADTSGGSAALEVVKEYSDRLTIHRSSGTTTTLDEIKKTIVAVTEKHGRAPFVCIDYLQKIPMPGTNGEEERITAVVEQVKDMTLDFDVPVLCVVASDKDGISSGKRMRVNHMRGSSALAYEADTVLMLNNKYDVVARHHLVYDTGNVERFRHWAVLSIEKNRSGLTGVDMEFPKRFEQSRFETSGQLVREKLVDERVFTE
ncbi:MAG TPA: DnaB-like helicase C-terminal domain-containing protein [Marmoricola sp.]|nr:DnaB-like helicase C-terminal domain-containing protein [Marmoricola sp.]